MKKSLHVLVLPSWYPTMDMPNYGIFFKEQAMALQKGGIEVGVVYSDISGLNGFRLKKIRHAHFQTISGNEDGLRTLRFKGWNLFPRSRRLQARYWINKTLMLIDKYIKKFGKPDLIHAHGVLWGGYAACVASEKYDIPYIITEHSSSFARGFIQEWEKPYIQKAYSEASEVIAVSSAFKRLLSDYIKNKDISVVPNMVDVEFFGQLHKADEPRTFTFLTVAFLTSVKGIEDLIKAFNKTFKDEDVILKIGGDGDQREELEVLVKELNLVGKVRFLGQLSREEVRSELWNSDIFVLPSRYETFGIVLIEALAAGVPVISTKCGGPEDIVSVETGILVEPSNIEQISEALRTMYNGYDKYNKDNIREFAKINYSSNAVADKLIEIYLSILKHN